MCSRPASSGWTTKRPTQKIETLNKGELRHDQLAPNRRPSGCQPRKRTQDQPSSGGPDQNFCKNSPFPDDDEMNSMIKWNTLKHSPFSSDTQRCLWAGTGWPARVPDCSGDHGISWAGRRLHSLGGRTHWVRFTYEEGSALGVQCS